MRTLDQLRVVHVQTASSTTSLPAFVPWPLLPAHDISAGPFVDTHDASPAPAAPHSAPLPPAGHANVKTSAVTGPTPGCVIKRRAAGRTKACSATALSSSAIDASS